MADSRDKRAAEIMDAIRQILRHDWNPIGFDDFLPEDEYDSYIGPVYRILAGTRSEDELIDYLRWRPATEERLRTIARKLLALNVKRRGRSASHRHMADSRDKRAAKIMDAIRQILYHDWDPISFGDLLPKDVDDNYIGPVYRILAGTRSEAELIDFLRFPLAAEERLRTIARKLLALNVKL